MIDPKSEKYGKYTPTRTFTGAIADQVGASEQAIPQNNFGWQSAARKGGFIAVQTAPTHSGPNALKKYKQDHWAAAHAMPKVWSQMLPPIWYAN